MEDIILFGGDVASDYEIFKLFIKLLRSELDKEHCDPKGFVYPDDCRPTLVPRSEKEMGIYTKWHPDTGDSGSRMPFSDKNPKCSLVVTDLFFEKLHHSLLAAAK